MPERKRPFRVGVFLYRHCRPLSRLYSLSKQGFPFMPPSRNSTPMRRLRSHARRNAHVHHPTLLRWFERAIMTLAWPVGALIETIYALRVIPGHPKSVRDFFSSGFRMLEAALCENVPLFEYTAFKLYEPARRILAKDYLYSTECNIFRLLNDRCGADNEEVQDKFRFAEICRQWGFPCIPTLAVYANGSQIFPDSPFLPHQPSLWVKDLRGSKGSGAGQWILQEGLYVSPEGHKKLPKELAESWLHRSCIVQPLLRNHAALDPVSDGNLAVIRIVSGIDTKGCVHLITHDISLPWGGFANRARSLIGKLDASGKIIGSFDHLGNSVPRHPETGALISDITVPYWQKAQELVKKAHRTAFSRFVFLGWDLAITAEGPVLIETNSGPGFFHHQLIDGIPLGHTAFSEIACSYLFEEKKCA